MTIRTESTRFPWTLSNTVHSTAYWSTHTCLWTGNGFMKKPLWYSLEVDGLELFTIPCWCIDSSDWLAGLWAARGESCDLIFIMCTNKYKHTHTHAGRQGIRPQAEQTQFQWGSRCDIKSAVFSYKWNSSRQVAGADIGLSSCHRPHQTVPSLHITANEQHAVHEHRPESRLPSYWPTHEFHVCRWQSGFSRTRSPGFQPL